MDFCQGCGARLAEGSRFCVQCGQAFRVDGSGAPPREGFGRKLSLVGPVALILFFLPWITVSCQMTGFSVALSGWELANGVTLADQRIPGQPILFLVPLASVALLAVALIGRGESGFARKPVAILQFMLAGGPLVLVLIKYLVWVEDARRNTGGLVTISPHFGLVLTALTFLAAGVGTVMDARGGPGFAARDSVALSSGMKPVAVGPSPAEQPGGLSFCPQCGTRTRGSSRFCVECGRALA